MTHRSTQGLHTFEEVRYTDRCKCPTCGEWFNSTRAFDRHRTSKAPSASHTDAKPLDALSRRCLAISEMIERGMSVSADSFWITSEKQPEAIAKRQGTANASQSHPPKGSP